MAEAVKTASTGRSGRAAAAQGQLAKERLSKGVRERQAPLWEAIATNAVCNSSVGAAGLLSPATRVTGGALPASFLGTSALRAAAYHLRRSAMYITAVRALSYAGFPPGIAVGSAMAGTTTLNAVGRPSTRSLASTASLCGVEWTAYLHLRERLPVAGDPVRGAAAGAFATAVATTIVLPITTGVKLRSLLSLRTLNQLGQRALEAGKQSALWYGLFEGIKGLAYTIDTPKQATLATSRPSPISEKAANSNQLPEQSQMLGEQHQPPAAAALSQPAPERECKSSTSDGAGLQRSSESSTSSSHLALQPFELPHWSNETMEGHNTATGGVSHSQSDLASSPSPLSPHKRQAPKVPPNGSQPYDPYLP